MKVRVFGEPIPQGSMRAFVVRKGGRPTSRAVVTADNARTKPWRQAVIDAWHAALVSGDWDGMPVNGATVPLRVTVIFLMPRPKSHYGSGRNAGQVRPSAPSAPAVMPDVDKLGRAVLDALKAAGAYRDDALVCDLHAIKTYTGPGEAPGAVIEITPCD